MGKNSKIQWTDHTFNPWMGCTKVSPGCVNCYAERDMDIHWHKVQWGPQGMRVRTSKANWRQPLKWNKDELWEQCIGCGYRGPLASFNNFRMDLEGDGGYTVDCPKCPSIETFRTRQRVFCASLADVGDHHPSVLNEWIEDLVRLIEQTQNLDWMLLTKRPEDLLARFGMFWGLERWPENVWVGVSTEDQKCANKRIPVLQSIPAAVRFVSCEPLLGYIDLSEAVEPDKEAWHEVSARQDDDEPEEFVEECEAECDWVNFGNDLVDNPEHREWVERRRLIAGFKTLKHGAIDLVIAGGESGSEARLTDPNWLRALRDECTQAGIRFFFKQWGENVPLDHLPWVTDKITFKHKPVEINGTMMARVGKGMAGRVLDGREWSEMPR